jgi:UrcA family protein
MPMRTFVMSHLGSRLALAALAVVATGLAGAAEARSGATGFHPTDRPIEINTSGLDLGTDAGRQALGFRVGRAARDHCLGAAPLPNRMMTIDYLLCVDEMRSDLQPEIERAIRARQINGRLAAN